MTAILILILVSLVKTLGLIFVVILPMVSYTVYAERRVSALIQDRLGPNRVGIFGLLQPIADAVKLFHIAIGVAGGAALVALSPLGVTAVFGARAPGSTLAWWAPLVQCQTSAFLPLP